MRVGMRIAALVVALVAATLLISGCERESAPKLATDLEGTWVLESFMGIDQVRPSAKGVTTVMTLDGGQASGSGGVNQFAATYNTPNDDALLFGLPTFTETAGEEAPMMQEKAFFIALSMTEFYEIDGAGKLVLKNGDKRAVAVFRPK